MGHEADIKAIFELIDTDANGILDVDELSRLEAVLSGDCFDRELFKRWCHTQFPDQHIDLAAFATFIASVAFDLNDEHPDEAMPNVLSIFHEKATIIRWQQRLSRG